jgi:hypothetical protein
METGRTTELEPTAHHHAGHASDEWSGLCTDGTANGSVVQEDGCSSGGAEELAREGPKFQIQRMSLKFFKDLWGWSINSFNEIQMFLTVSPT